MQSERGNSQYFLTWLAPLALLVLVAVTYRDAPQNAFHLDDVPNIVRHPPVIVEELTVENLVAAGRGAFLESRPLPSVLFAFDWYRGGGSAQSFQYTNVAIHWATAVVVFWLMLLLLRRLDPPAWAAMSAAFIGAVLWACHPIQVQAVTYVVQRMTSMAALFTMLTIILYILGRQAGQPGRRWLYFALAALCWMLGLASKETAAIVPFLVLLAEYGVLRHGESLIRRKIDWALLALPGAVATLIVIDIASGAGPLSEAFLPGYDKRDFTLAERLLTQPRVIAFHFSQILWPLPGRFSLEHDLTLSSGLLSPVSTLLAILAMIAWCALGVWAIFRPRWRVVGFLLLWVPATLVIESTFIGLEMVFEHRMYLPSVALAGLVSFGLVYALERVGRFRPALLAGCVLVVGLLILSTSQRVPDWRSTVSLAQAAVQTSPGSARAWATLANAYKEAGAGWDRIRPPMLRALQLDPDQTLALQLQVFWLLQQERFDEADAALNRFGDNAQRDHRFLNTLGMLRLEQRDFEAAVRSFEQALQINVSIPEVHYNLALTYELWGRCAVAHQYWIIYLQQDSDERRRAAVRSRLQNNFETMGGRCYGWERSR